MGVLDERQRRWAAGWKAERLRDGGVDLISQITLLRGFSTDGYFTSYKGK